MKDLILYPLLIYLLIVYCIFIYISICFFFYINQCLFFIYYSHRDFYSRFLIRVTIGNDKDESVIKMRELSTRQFLVTILKCCKLTMRQMEKTIERKRRESRPIIVRQAQIGKFNWRLKSREFYRTDRNGKYDQIRPSLNSTIDR